jgi:hypothetical protein
MTARFDSVSTIHKAVRKILFEHAMMLARTDFFGESAGRDVVASTQLLFALLREHADIEDTLVFPTVAARDAKLAAEAAVQHAALETSMHEIEHLAATAAMVTTSERPAVGRKLRARFEQFVAEQLMHMAFEETKINAALWAAFDDDQIRALHFKIVGSMAPERAAAWRVLMLDAVDARERAMLAA